VTFGNGWINADIRGDIKTAVESRGHAFEYCDVRQPLRWEDNSVSLITAHHLLEHLTREEGETFMGECLRILKPSGVIRVSTPDLEILCRRYMYGNFIEDFKDENEGVENARDSAEAFFNMTYAGHKTLYDLWSLCALFERAGFNRVGRCNYGVSRSEEIKLETKDSFPSHSIYIEAEKPSQRPIETPPQMDVIVKASERKPVITVGEELQPYQKYLEGLIPEGEQRWDE